MKGQHEFSLLVGAIVICIQAEPFFNVILSSSHLISPNPFPSQPRALQLPPRGFHAFASTCIKAGGHSSKQRSALDLKLVALCIVSGFPFSIVYATSVWRPARLDSASSQSDFEIWRPEQHVFSPDCGCRSAFHPLTYTSDGFFGRCLPVHCVDFWRYPITSIQKGPSSLGMCRPQLGVAVQGFFVHLFSCPIFSESLTHPPLRLTKPQSFCIMFECGSIFLPQIIIFLL